MISLLLAIDIQIGTEMLRYRDCSLMLLAQGQSAEAGALYARCESSDPTVQAQPIKPGLQAQYEDVVLFIEGAPTEFGRCQQLRLILGEPSGYLLMRCDP